jgi:hypothetical protein
MEGGRTGYVKSRNWLAIVVPIVLALTPPSSRALADVVVLANRTPVKVRFAIIQADKKVTLHDVDPQDVVAIPVSEQVTIAFDVHEPRRSVLEQNSIHYFQVVDRRLELFKLALDMEVAAAGQPPDNARSVAGGDDPTASESHRTPTDREVVTIPVKILVDDEEPSVKRVWEQRLRRRVAQASQILERYCGVQLQVVATGSWESDDSIVDFSAAGQEFQREVSAAPARLAIGFTAQHQESPTGLHASSLTQPLGSHILLREWSPGYTPASRLELLVHELGHFLGAVHTPEPTSVMRVTIGDQRSHATSFRIGFDPLNTLAMNLVSQELRQQVGRPFDSLSDPTRIRLARIYGEMAQVFPQDSTARDFTALLSGGDASAADFETISPDPLVRATQVVVREIARTAAQESSARLGRKTGDALTALLVRRAAEVAAPFSEDVANNAFLLGVGIALGDTAEFSDFPRIARLCGEVETPEQRTERLRGLGEPTVRGRRDLARHFFVSSALAAALGSRAADAAGLAKELHDARGASGFSYRDLCADVAGVTLATELTQSRLHLNDLASSFTVDDFVPSVADLKEGISWDELITDRGLAVVDDLRREIQTLRQRTLALPGYVSQHAQR